MRGDEPDVLFLAPRRELVFPACAGMNRPGPAARLGVWCVPRMRGDEPPAQVIAGDESACSPHARG